MLTMVVVFAAGGQPRGHAQLDKGNFWGHRSTAGTWEIGSFRTSSCTSEEMPLAPVHLCHSVLVFSFCLSSLLSCSNVASLHELFNQTGIKYLVFVTEYLL